MLCYENRPLRSVSKRDTHPKVIAADIGRAQRCLGDSCRASEHCTLHTLQLRCSGWQLRFAGAGADGRGALGAVWMHHLDSWAATSSGHPEYALIVFGVLITSHGACTYPTSVTVIRQ